MYLALSLGRFSLSSASLGLILARFLLKTSMTDISTVFHGLEVILWAFCVGVAADFSFHLGLFNNF